MRTSWQLIWIGACLNLIAGSAPAKAHPNTLRLRQRSKFLAQRDAGVNTTACIAELPDPVSEVTAYKLTNVLFNEGQYYISESKSSSEAVSHLPDGVINVLKGTKEWDERTCALDESRRVVLLDIWPGDFNTYHNIIFYVRQYVHTVLDAWGPQAFTDPDNPLYYGFFSPDKGTFSSEAANLKVYRSLEVFFSGSYSNVVQAENSPCVLLKNVVLTPKVHYYSRMYNTQLGVQREAEMRVYSLMRSLYIKKYLSNVPNAFSSAEDAPIKILYLGRPRHNTRYIINEEELTAALEALFGSMKGVELNIHHDFGSQPFEDQIATAATSDIMIGPHGAGMTHILFLKPQSVLIELIPEGWADPGYRNLAIFSEKTYLFWQQTNDSLSQSTAIIDGKAVNLGRSNNFAVNVVEVMDLLRVAIKVVSMVGSRYWPDCPGHEFLHYSRAVPIRCAKLWIRDEGIKGDTPLERMLRLLKYWWRYSSHCDLFWQYLRMYSKFFMHTTRQSTFTVSQKM